MRSIGLERDRIEGSERGEMNWKQEMGEVINFSRDHLLMYATASG